MKESLWPSLRDNLLRAGLKKDVYESVKPLIRVENVRIMYRLGIIGILFGGTMTVLSLAGVLSERVLPAYLTLLIASVIFTGIQRVFRKKNKLPPAVLAYLEMITVLIYGVLNSSFCAPNPATVGVTVIVLITLVPFLLIDVPWRNCLIIIGTVVLYLIGVHTCKAEAIHNIEVTNTISFGVVACLCANVFTTRTIHSMADRLYIEKERDTDSLTGLSSRHAGEVLIRSILLRGIRGVFVMIDVDDFKSVNDRYGHPFGDRVLQQVGSSISASIRRKDVACRYGGDEFCIFLVDCEMKDAEKIIMRIQKFLHESEKELTVHITCSFGLAEARVGEELHDLTVRADEVLYQAKRSGKNHYRSDSKA